MKTNVFLAEVRNAGVVIEADEAVAIVQQLIVSLRNGGADTAEAPFGPPTLATVTLNGDGSVICRACETTPAVSEIAILLQMMLPAESGRVPGGLRYAIARALLDVEVPPFDSLADFSETLARYERGPREEAIGRVLQRFESSRALVPLWSADRRRHPHATELRRALREADARLYLQKLAADAVAAPVAPPPSQPGRAAAACVAAGLTLIAAGEFIDGWHHPSVLTPASAVRPAAIVSNDVELVRDERAGAADGAASATVDSRTANDEGQSVRPRVKRASRITRAQASRPSTRRASSPRAALRRASSPGVLDRLHLNWLRTVFTSP
jgi:hypothetical protein